MSMTLFLAMLICFAFSISIADREIYLSIGNETLTGTVRRLALDG